MEDEVDRRGREKLMSSVDVVRESNEKRVVRDEKQKEIHLKEWN